MPEMNAIQQKQIGSKSRSHVEFGRGWCAGASWFRRSRFGVRRSLRSVSCFDIFFLFIVLVVFVGLLFFFKSPGIFLFFVAVNWFFADIV